MKHEQQKVYTGREQQNLKIIENLSQRIRIIGWSRGLVFVAGFALGIWLAYIFWPVAVAVFLISALLFVGLLKKNTKHRRQLEYHQELLKINQNERAALNWKYNVFPDGKKYIDPDKTFLYDLDIFGDGSLFQFLNRSATQSGEHFLASLFLDQEKEAAEIESRQLAVVELMPLLDWRQDFQASGKRVKEKEEERISLRSWMNSEMFFHKIRGIHFFIRAVPFTSALFLGLTILDIIPASVLILYFLITLGFEGRYLQHINKTHNLVSKMLTLARKYAVLLKKIENADFKSTRLGKHQYSLKNEKGTASKKVAELAALIHSLDNRNNMIMGVVLNALLLWDLKFMLKLEDWRTRNHQEFDHWVKVTSEFDAFSSLANFAYNNPEYVFPDVGKGEFNLSVKGAGHPLIPEKVRVNNDISLPQKGQFFIITGANMAGKSTFLRTLGVNLCLAMTGAPVCASRFAFKPVDVFTSMRTNDSLQKNESYFFAELNRLKILIDQLDQGKELFIILDEVLKGTNSRDKRLGSLALVKQLVRMKATGIIATHDVSLGDLEKEFPNHVSNRRFEVEIENDELIFDYKLKEGISQNLNATFLMKKMGITI